MSRVNFFGARDIPDVENLDLQMYRETAEILMCELLPDSPTATTNRTESRIGFLPIAFPWSLCLFFLFYFMLFRKRLPYYVDYDKGNDKKYVKF